MSKKFKPLTTRPQRVKTTYYFDDSGRVRTPEKELVFVVKSNLLNRHSVLVV